MTSLQAAEFPGTKTGTKGTSLHFSLLRRDGQRGRHSSFAISSQVSAALLRATTKVSVNTNDSDESSFISVQISVKYSTAKVQPESKVILYSCTRPDINKHS